MFVSSKLKSVLECLTTEPVKSDAVSRNRNLEDTNYRSINLAGGSGERMSVESTEINGEIHNTGFKVMALNIFSLMPHLDQLRIFVNEQRPHIIGITETKIDSTIDNSYTLVTPRAPQHCNSMIAKRSIRLNFMWVCLHWEFLFW